MWYIIGAAIVTISAVIAGLWRAFMTEDNGRHSNIAGTTQASTERWLRDARSLPDDTQQMSSFDRSLAAAHERVALHHEHELFLADDARWAKDIRAIFADAAAIEADLQSGRLAFPEWIWRPTNARTTTSAIR